MSDLKIVGDTVCPSCRANGRDATGNHLIIFENTKGERFAKCNRCGHYVPPADYDPERYKPAPRREWTPEEIANLVAEIDEFQTQALTSRGIPLHVAERFGVKVGLDEVHAQAQVAHYYPITKKGEKTAFQVKNLEFKNFYFMGDSRGCDLGGQVQADRPDTSSKKLFLFEDALSAMSGYTVLEMFSADKWKHIKPSCVWLTHGAKSAIKCLENNMDFINKYEEIVLCMDNDEAGRTAVDEILKLIPNCKVATTPLKDANDMVMAKRYRELYSALLGQAQTKTPDDAVDVMDVLDEALAEPEWGLTFPWEGLTDLTYGLRFGEVIAVGGGVGIGKTLLAHEIAAHLFRTYKMKVGMILLEERAGDTVKNVAGKLDDTPYHIPGVEYDKEKLKQTAVEMNGSIFLYRNKGQNNWDTIKQIIRWWVVTRGVKFIMLDNVTALVSHLNPTEINTEIGRMASELAGMCDELDFTCFVFSHLNAPTGGKTHEEGAEVKEAQFTGSRALMRWCQLIIGFERNKQAEGDNKHNSRIRILKDRKYGRTGYVETQYVPETGRLIERPEEVEENDDDRQF